MRLQLLRGGAGAVTPRIEVIQALLAKAESTSFAGERDALLEKVGELVARYGIDEALLRRSGTAQERITTKTITLRGEYRQAHGQLLNTVTLETGARGFYVRPPRGDKNLYYTVVAYPADLRRIEVIFTSLQLQAATALGEWWRELRATRSTRGWTGMDRFKVRRSFLLGFAGAVGERLRAARERAEGAAEAAEPGTGLVLRGRGDELDDFLRQFNLRARSGSLQVTRLGGDAGARAGLTAELDGGLDKASARGELT